MPQTEIKPISFRTGSCKGINYVLLTISLLIGTNRASAQTSTWDVIQDRILTPRCAGCHVAGSSFATQSGLILTEDVAYEQLVNRMPYNAAARSDGLMRVGTQGLPSLYKSYLWEKIDAPSQDHFYTDHPYYGALMPLGAPPLTNGELKFIRDWIVAGAPETGVVVDEAELQDTSRYKIPEFQPLALPEFGQQFHLGPFEVPPNFEREFFYYEPLNDNEDIYIKRVEISMRRGSHHFIAYTFVPDTPPIFLPEPGVIRDFRRSDGTYITENLLPALYHTFVSGTQWPFLNYHLPPGVALRLPANSGLDLNPHYVNRTNQHSQGEVYMNLHYADPSEVVHEARVLNLGNYEIDLPPGKVTTLTKTFIFGERRNIIQLFSHAHEHMTEFRAEVVGGPRHGELIYIAYDWEHPPILELDPPLVLEPGQGLKLSTTYDNWTDRTLQFGLRSDDEMMFLFGIYYIEAQTDVEETAPSLAREFALDQNYPNPFNPLTTISYSIANPGFVELSIYDLNGRLVKKLFEGQQTSGQHSVNWNADGFPSGMYLIRMRFDEQESIKKILLLK